MNPMTYQKHAHEFVQYVGNPTYPALGLCEEAGEVAGKIAKYIRKHTGLMPAILKNSDLPEHEIEFRNGLSKELGDVCWMVAELCTTCGLDLEEVMEENIAKLQDRKNRNVIVG